MTPPAEKTDGSSRSRKLAVFLLAAVPALLAFYLVVANILLATPALRALLSGNPDNLRVRYARAYSVWPGKVALSHVQVRGRDGSVEWLLELETARVSINIIDLARKRFHLSAVHGDDLTFRLRRRLDALASSAPKVKAFPHIEGFADPPLHDPVPSSAPPTDENYHLWTVILEDVNVENVHGIWVDEIQFAGVARLQGRMFLKPLRHLDVLGSLDVGKGSVQLGKDAIVSNLVGRIECGIAALDLRDRQTSPLDHVSGRVQTFGRLGDLRYTNAYFEQVSPPLTSGEGNIATDVKITHGIIQAGSSTKLEVSNVKLVVGDVVLTGAPEIHFTVAKEGMGDEAHGVVAVRHGVIVTSPLSAFPADLGDFNLNATSPSLHLSTLFNEATLRASLQDGSSDLRALNYFLLGGDTRVVSGQVKLSATAYASFPSRTIRGDFHVVESGARVRSSGMAVSGDMAAHGALKDWTLGAEVVRISDVEVKLSRVGVNQSVDEAWWSTFHAPEVMVNVGSTPMLRTRLTGKLKDVNPILAATVRGGGIPSIVRTLFKMSDVTASAELSIGKQRIDAQRVKLSGGAYDVQAEYRSEANASRAAVLVTTGAIGVGVGVTNGTTNVELTDATRWYAKEAKSIHP